MELSAVALAIETMKGNNGKLAVFGKKGEFFSAYAKQMEINYDVFYVRLRILSTYIALEDIEAMIPTAACHPMRIEMAQNVARALYAGNPTLEIHYMSEGEEHHLKVSRSHVRLGDVALCIEGTDTSSQQIYWNDFLRVVRLWGVIN